MDTHVLLGAEEVSRAASSMRQAAHDMLSAANTIQYVFEQQRAFLDEWLARLEAVLTETRPAP